MSKRYIQFYDNNGLEVLGSDGVMFFDQRFSNGHAITEAVRRAYSLIAIRKLCYARVFAYPIGRGNALTGTAMVIDPVYADYLHKKATALLLLKFKR
jgi:hypothetical protein